MVLYNMISSNLVLLGMFYLLWTLGTNTEYLTCIKQVSVNKIKFKLQNITYNFNYNLLITMKASKITVLLIAVHNKTSY